MSERTTDGRSVWVEVANEMLASAGEWTKEPLYVKCEPRPDDDGAVHLTFQRLAPNERVVAVGEEAVERVAIALGVSPNEIGHTWETTPDDVQEFWRRRAQTALTALTEPRP